MRILYIIATGVMGGIERHVQCLARCLKDVAQVKVLILGAEGPIAEAMKADGIDVEAFGCSSGHDFRIFPKLRRLIKTWKPDVVCPQGFHLFPMVYFNLIDRTTPVIRSIHTPTKMHSRIERIVENLLGRRFDYHLPVSSSTWAEFLSVYPWAKGKGEVFFNPLYRISPPNPQPSTPNPRPSTAFVVGAVGRAADQKDWPSFAVVAKSVGDRDGHSNVTFLGVGVTREQAADLPGMNEETLGAVDWKGPQSNGREWIGKFDLFVMTSKHEQLPTTVLECFAEGTPICGFIPDGGMTDILQFSSGPLKSVFVKERDCEKLAEVVRRIAAAAEFRQALIEDGRQILDGHFDAMKNCRGQLLDIYKRFAK